MKKLIFGTLAAAIFVVPCYSQAVLPGVPATPEAHEVFATLTKWADAVKARDQKTLESIFAEGLIITPADGRVRGKKEELELYKPNPGLRTLAVTNEDVKVRFFGNAAVVTGLTKMQQKLNERDIAAAFRFTAVFTKEDGRWQLVALHTGRAS